MKQVRAIAIILSLTACIAFGAPLPDGRYFLQSDVLPDGLCTVTSTNGVSRLVHHESHFTTVINLKSAWRGRIKIVDSTIPTQEFSISVSGSASRQEDGSFSGRIKQRSYFIPFLPMRTEKGTWSLRRATSEDTDAAIKRILEEATGSLARRRRRRSSADWEPELMALHGATFLPEVIEMFKSGAIVVEDNRFRLKHKRDSQQPDGEPTQEAAQSATP